MHITALYWCPHFLRSDSCELRKVKEGNGWYAGKDYEELVKVAEASYELVNMDLSYEVNKNLHSSVWGSKLNNFYLYLSPEKCL